MGNLPLNTLFLAVKACNTHSNVWFDEWKFDLVFLGKNSLHKLPEPLLHRHGGWGEGDIHQHSYVDSVSRLPGRYGQGK